MSKASRLNVSDIPEANDLVMRLILQDETAIDIFRMVDKTIAICRDGSCMVLPNGTANQVVGFFALLQPFISAVETQDGNNAL